MKLSLSELRVKLNQASESIISGLKNRSRYPTNFGVFNNNFGDGERSWFDDRMHTEQTIDARYGRFEFPGQYTFYGEDMSHLSLVRRDVPDIGLKRVAPSRDLGTKVVDLYKRIVAEICKEGEEQVNYGQVAKLDVANCLDIFERITYLGQQVAQSKLDKMPFLPNKSPEDIRVIIRNEAREREVIEAAKEIAKKYELSNPESASRLLEGMIPLTIDIEIDYIKAHEIPHVRRIMGFGQSRAKKSGVRVGWG